MKATMEELRTRLGEGVGETTTVARPPHRPVGNGEIGRLISDVDELVRKVAQVNDSDLAVLRQRVEKALDVVRYSLRQGAHHVSGGARRVADVTDSYVHDRPWSAVGVATAVGVLIGILSSRR